MSNRIQAFQSSLFTAKWVILLIDVSYSVLCFLLANFLLHEFNILNASNKLFVANLHYIVLARTIAFLIFETHTSDYRYLKIKDLLGIFVSLLFGSMLIFIGNLVNIHTFNSHYILTTSLILADFLCVFFVLVTYRLVVKGLYHRFVLPRKKPKNAAIFGIDEKELLIKKYIDKNVPNIRIVAFFDINKSNTGKTLESLPIYYIDDLNKVIMQFKISHLLIPHKFGPELTKKISKKSSGIQLRLVEFPDLNLNVIRFYKKDFLKRGKSTNIEDDGILNEYIMN